MMTAAFLAGCGAGTGEPAAGQTAAEKPAADQAAGSAQEEGQAADQAKNSTAEEVQKSSDETASTQGGAEQEDSWEEREQEGSEAEAPAVTVKVGSLKGPTSIGLMHLMDRASRQETADQYEFTMAAAADELLPQIISGDLDILLIPANVAGVLYMKTEGGISVIDINTLGVLYMVSGDDTIQDMEDLKGRTVCLTGKGTTPDYVLQYLLRENGLSADDVTLEYKSEAVEVAAVLAGAPETIGVLPQPFVTAACAQNEELSVVMDLTEEWDILQDRDGSVPDGTKSRLVTGVTVVRNGFLEEHKESVDRFLEEHAASAAYANEHVDETAELVAAAGIIEKAPVAAKAIPACNITCIDGVDMREADRKSVV